MHAAFDKVLGVLFDYVCLAYRFKSRQNAASDDFYVRAGTRHVLGDYSQKEQEGRRKRHYRQVQQGTINPLSTTGDSAATLEYLAIFVGAPSRFSWLSHLFVNTSLLFVGFRSLHQGGPHASGAHRRRQQADDRQRYGRAALGGVRGAAEVRKWLGNVLKNPRCKLPAWRRTAENVIRCCLLESSVKAQRPAVSFVSCTEWVISHLHMLVRIRSPTMVLVQPFMPPIMV